MEVLKRRLEEAGLEGRSFQFVEDHDEPSKESQTASVVSVKTLIWEVIFECEAEKERIHTCYFSSALRSRDRVDEEKLKRFLMEEDAFKTVFAAELQDQESMASPILGLSNNNGCRRNATEVKIKSLGLTETKKAEELTGYMSGVIPPIGHVKPTPLVLDQALACESNNSDNAVLLSLGSGSFQHSLQMSMKDLLDYANALARGVCLASIASTTTPNSCPKEKPSDDVNQRIAIKSIIPPEEEYKISGLTKLLRKACLQEGKIDIIQSVIDQAGDRFPEVT